MKRRILITFTQLSTIVISFIITFSTVFAQGKPEAVSSVKSIEFTRKNARLKKSSLEKKQVIFLTQNINSGETESAPKSSSKNNGEVANENSEEDEFDFGEEEKKDEKKGGGEEKAKSGLSLRGSVSIESSAQTEKFRWIRLGPAVHLLLNFPNNIVNIYGEATGRLNGAYTIEGDPAEVVDNYTGEFIGRELYLQKEINIVSVIVGNKMVVWSEADLLPVLDLISVADMTESIFANPEGARLGQNIIETDVFFENSEVNVVFIPLPVFNRLADGGHPYSMIPGQAINAVDEFMPAEWAVRYRYVGKKISVSVVGGEVHNRTAIFSIGSDGVDSLHEKFGFAGLGVTLAMDPILWKLESRYSFEMPLQNTIKVQACGGCAFVDYPNGVYKDDQAALTFGFDWNAGDAGQFIVESTYSQEKANFGEPKKIAWSAAVGWSKSTLRDQLVISVFSIFPQSFEDAVARVMADWSVRDNLSVALQYTAIWENSGNAEVKQLEEYDRADIAIKYHFEL